MKKNYRFIYLYSSPPEGGGFFPEKPKTPRERVIEIIDSFLDHLKEQDVRPKNLCSFLKAAGGYFEALPNSSVETLGVECVAEELLAMLKFDLRIFELKPYFEAVVFDITTRLDDDEDLAEQMENNHDAFWRKEFGSWMVGLLTEKSTMKVIGRNQK